MIKKLTIFFFLGLTLSVFGGKKPKTIDEAIQYFEKKWNDKEKLDYKSLPEKKAVNDTHFDIGIWIRNEWIRKGKDTSLLSQFHLLGIYHHEDMSGIILTSLHRKLNNEPIDIEGQVNYYKEFWKPINVCDKKAESAAVENYKKFKTGDSITVFMKVDDGFGNRDAMTVGCPDTEWSFNYKKDLIVKGIVNDKYFMDNENNVFLKVKITYMNFADTKILHKNAKAGDVYDFPLKHLLIKQ